MKSGKLLFKHVKINNSYDKSQLEMIKYFTNLLKGAIINENHLAKFYKNLSLEHRLHLTEAVQLVKELNIFELFFKS